MRRITRLAGSKRTIVAVIVGIVLLSAGCTSVGGAPDFSGAFGQVGGGGGGGSDLPQRPRPSPQSGGDVLGTSDLHALYQAIVDVYVDPVEPPKLISGALRGAHQASLEAGLLPIESAVFDTANVRSVTNPDVAWNQWAEIYDGFMRKLVPRVNISGIGQGAAQGMLDSLGDPNSTYFKRQAFEAQQLSDYVGVGVVLAPTGERGAPVVREVTAGSPAETAGLKVGDVILSVAGRSTETSTLGESVDAVRGAEGTQVAMSVRSPQGTTRELEVRRGVVRANAVNADIRSGVTYIRVRALQDGTAAAVRTVLLLNTNPTRGWVIDLRGNDRGSLQEAVNVASLFVGDQIVAIQEDKARRRAPIRGVGRPISPLLPVVVIVDEGTGGSAEVLAAALKDLGIAYVVGTKTAGKAARTQQIPLPDGSVAQITSHHLLGPSGGQLHRQGLTPDEAVEATVQDWVSGRDVQLERAMARVGA